MANIQERRNKEGKLISYSIRVHRGRDTYGKQLKPYSTTFEVPEGWTEAKAKREAEKEGIRFEEKCKAGLITDNKQTFEKYAAYVMALKARDKKHRTVERYNELLIRINDAIGHIKLSDLKPQHLNQFYDNLAEPGMNKRTGGFLSSKTILEHHRLISTILTQAEKELLIPFNPARRATPPKVEKTQANYFQIETVNRITECLENEPIKWKALTYLLILSGCRRGEILGLKWSAVDLNKGMLKINNNLQYSKVRGIYEDTTKTGKSRLVMIPPEAVQMLKQYKSWYLQEKLANGDRWQANSVWKGSDFVFVQDGNHPGNPMHPDSITIWLKRFSEKHDLPHINPHAFRHTFASVLISRGVDIVTVSKTLGHEKVSTTIDVYAEMMKEASEEASETIANVIFRSVK